MPPAKLILSNGNMRHAIADLPEDVLITTLSLIPLGELPLVRQVCSLFNRLTFLSICYKIEHSANYRSNDMEGVLTDFISEKTKYSCIPIRHVAMICPLRAYSDLGKAYTITNSVYDRPEWADPTSPIGAWCTKSVVLLVKYNSSTVIFSEEDRALSVPKLEVEGYLKRTRFNDTSDKGGGKRQKLFIGYTISSLLNTYVQCG